MLGQRVITAIVMLIVLYAGTAWLSPAAYAGFLSLIMLPALLEWAEFIGLQRKRDKMLWLLLVTTVLIPILIMLVLPGGVPSSTGVAIVSAVAMLYWFVVFWLIRDYPQGQQRWDSPWKIGVMGVISLLPTWVGLFYLKILDPSGLLVFCLIGMVSIVDIGAYFSGRAWGKAKLAPTLSPKKSWAGFWGGLASCAALTSAILAWVHISIQPLSVDLWILLLVAAMLLAVFSVVGDLFESMLKRHRGMKDSGRLLPGHGGFLDRIDSLMAATPVFVLALVILSQVLTVI
ncbi:MAG TPA: phosphatidate cytidylyltransferase [Pseudohongiella sp.]|nr:phosphatidate cytidylyltransferase [Pseudohongiella sp.]